MEEPAKTDLLTIEGLCARLMISETMIMQWKNCRDTLIEDLEAH